MKRNFHHLILALVAAGTAAFVPATHAQIFIEKQADDVMRQMGELLANADQFSFKAEIGYDEFVSWGQEIEFGGDATIYVKRPNHLNVDYHGDHRKSRVVFDGETLVFHDLFTNLFARMVVPGKIDNAIDELFSRYGYSIPLADFLYANPYEVLMENAEYGVVVGRHVLPDDKVSYHLAFSGEVLDWQIWIEEGPDPLPRRLVITYKEQPGAPQYRASLTDWSLEPDLPDDMFKFTPRDGAAEIEFLPVRGMAAQAEDKQ